MKHIPSHNMASWRKFNSIDRHFRLILLAEAPKIGCFCHFFCVPKADSLVPRNVEYRLTLASETKEYYDYPCRSYLSEVSLAQDGEQPEILAVVLPGAVAKHVCQFWLVDLKRTILKVKYSYVERGTEKGKKKSWILLKMSYGKAIFLHTEMVKKVGPWLHNKLAH